MKSDKIFLHIIFIRIKNVLFPPTLILRHRKENLKKCSLRGLEKREDMIFHTYPKQALPDLSKYVLLSLDGPALSLADKDEGLFLIDSTWRYVSTMQKAIPSTIKMRSLPKEFQTAYPRRQDDCSDPTRGLASLEALYVAYFLLTRKCDGLLDHYYWKEAFIEKNSFLFRN